jgi:hypothetical protein
MITPELVQELVKQGVAAGVRTGTDYGRPGVADAPTTRVTVATPDGTQSVTAEALSEAQATDPQLTAEQKAARAKLSDFVKRLTDLPLAQGAPAQAAYDATMVAALAWPYTAPADGQKQPELAWTGPALPGDIINKVLGMGCVVVTGTQKDQIVAAAQKATAITPWKSGGKAYAIRFRPLLPDEAGCAALQGDK